MQTLISLIPFMKIPSNGWYAVLGDPIEHSQSPFIHSAFARQTGIDLRYEKIRIPADQFEPILNNLIADHLLGANVTIPHKFDAFHFASEKTCRAAFAQAANTLVIRSDGIIADNTDGIGLVTDIEKNAGFPLANANILIIGAGGAVSGILPSILDCRPASVMLANRSLDKAEKLVDQLSHLANDTTITVASFDGLRQQHFDLIINGTSTGLTGASLELPDDIFTNCSLVYDMMYGKNLAFLEKAKQLGACSVRDGLGMLVEQAAESFYLWHGVKPDTLPVLDILRHRLDKSNP